MTNLTDAPTPDDKHIQDIHDIGMAQSLEDLDLPKGSHRHAFLLVVHEDTFEGNKSLGGFLDGLVDFSNGQSATKVNSDHMNALTHPKVPSPSFVVTS